MASLADVALRGVVLRGLIDRELATFKLADLALSQQLAEGTQAVFARQFERWVGMRNALHDLGPCERRLALGEDRIGSSRLEQLFKFLGAKTLRKIGKALGLFFRLRFRFRFNR